MAFTPSVFPTNPGVGPGQFKDIRTPAKLLKLVDPISTIGSVWAAYQALDPSSVPSQTWSQSSVFGLMQRIQPTAPNGNGYYFTCTAAGTTGTVEPVWPSKVGTTVVDGGVTWTCSAPICQFLVPGDSIVVDPGNSAQMEKVTVAGVSTSSPAGLSVQATPGFAYVLANWTKSHDAGAPMTTGNHPYWWSTQRLDYVVIPVAMATDPPTRKKVDALMGKLLRGVDSWAILAPTSTTPTGGTVGPLVVGAPMGASPIAQYSYLNAI